MMRAAGILNATNNLLLVVLSSIVALVAVEAGTRWWYGIPVLEARNFASINIYPDTRPSVRMAYERGSAADTVSGDSEPRVREPILQYHPVLGWLQTQSGYYDPVRGWLNPSGENEQGIGVYYAQPPIEKIRLPVLTIGDSFTIGPGYGSPDSWPRQLADMMRSPVINAGVGGYGVDQMYLHLKILLERVRPGVIVFAFIPDDFHRSELSTFHSAPKPYFTIENGKLSLRNVPVPRYEPTAKHIGAFRQIAGYSYAIHRIALGLGYAKDWIVEHGELREEHKMGGEIGCLVMRELRRIQDERNVPVVVLALHSPDDLDESVYPDSHRKQKKAVACARSEGLAVVDTLPMFTAMLTAPGASKQQILSTYWLYPRDPHPSPAGYRFAAELVAPDVERALQGQRANRP